MIFVPKSFRSIRSVSSSADVTACKNLCVQTRVGIAVSDTETYIWRLWWLDTLWMKERTLRHVQSVSEHCCSNAVRWDRFHGIQLPTCGVHLIDVVYSSLSPHQWADYEDVLTTAHRRSTSHLENRVMVCTHDPNRVSFNDTIPRDMFTGPELTFAVCKVENHLCSWLKPWPWWLFASKDLWVYYVFRSFGIALRSYWL